MMFHLVPAYGMAIAIVSVLAVCGVRNHRAGWRRERRGGVLESWELWLNMNTPISREKEPMAAFKPATPPAERPSVLSAADEQMSLQLNHLHIALASSGTPAVCPEPPQNSHRTEEAQEKVS
jgi:hypothetical protein